MTRREILAQMKQELMEAGIESADYEAKVLFEWILKIDRSEFYMNPGLEVSFEEQKELEDVLEKRKQRIPLQYLMKSANFMGYDFYVNENVLIPRMDTECLVEIAVDDIQRRKGPVRVLDLCCGSGCIGISIKKLCSNTEVTLVDISEGALEVSEINAKQLDANVQVVHSDLFEALRGQTYDLILSNPPYIPTKVIEDLMPEVREHEPMLALDGTEDGLYFYKKISATAPKYLAENGMLLFEIGAEQGKDVKHLMEEAGFDHVIVKKDLAGLDRNVFGVKR